MNSFKKFNNILELQTWDDATTINKNKNMFLILPQRLSKFRNKQEFLKTQLSWQDPGYPTKISINFFCSLQTACKFNDTFPFLSM